MTPAPVKVGAINFGLCRHFSPNNTFQSFSLLSFFFLPSSPCSPVDPASSLLPGGSKSQVMTEGNWINIQLVFECNEPPVAARCLIARVDIASAPDGPGETSCHSCLSLRAYRGFTSVPIFFPNKLRIYRKHQNESISLSFPDIRAPLHFIYILYFPSFLNIHVNKRVPCTTRVVHDPGSSWLLLSFPFLSSFVGWPPFGCEIPNVDIAHHGLHLIASNSFFSLLFFFIFLDCACFRFLSMPAEWAWVWAKPAQNAWCHDFTFLFLYFLEQTTEAAAEKSRKIMKIDRLRYQWMEFLRYQ